MAKLDRGKPDCTADEHAPDAARQPLADGVALEIASRLFRAIGDPSRLRILTRLAQGEMCVTGIAALEGESLSTISQRLRVLRSENIIVRRRRGKHINYGLADQHVMDLVFNALAHAAERPAAVPDRRAAASEKRRTPRESRTKRTASG